MVALRLSIFANNHMTHNSVVMGFNPTAVNMCEIAFPSLFTGLNLYSIDTSV